MRQRIMIVSVLALLAGMAPIRPPVAAADTDFVDRFVETELQAVPAGSPTTQVLQRVVDAQGQVLDRSTTTVENPQIRPMEASPFACQPEGHRSDFRQHDQWEAIKRGKNDFLQFQFFPYSIAEARPDEMRRFTQQWLICAVGGADSDNGSRVTVSGPGMAYRDAGATYRIGTAWKEGSTPANYSLSLGFQTGGKVSVGGAIQQTPHHSLKGSVRPPMESELDRFARNGANGWWEHSCRPRCSSFGGSGDFQGSVVEALWEFPQGKPVKAADFAMSGFTRHHCANPSGC